MSKKKEKTCRKCGHKYTGRHCMNRSCLNYHQGKAKARAASSRRSGGKMRFGQLSLSVAPVAGQGGSQISVNPSAVSTPSETVVIPEEMSWFDWVERQNQRTKMIERANTDFEFFLLLCTEDGDGLLATEDEQFYARYGM